MSFEVDGKLHKKFETESKTATFQAREFVIEIADGNYPQMVKFQLVQDRCGLIDDYSEGDQVKIHFDLRGREWNGKYFTNLNAWRIEAGGAITSAAPSTQPNEFGSDFPSADDEPSQQSMDDDLPF
jgi:single-strand DNA-binding protein